MGFSGVTLKTCPVDISQMHFFFGDKFFPVQKGPNDQTKQVPVRCGGGEGDVNSAPGLLVYF